MAKFCILSIKSHVPLITMPNGFTYVYDIYGNIFKAELYKDTIYTKLLLPTPFKGNTYISELSDVLYKTFVKKMSILLVNANFATEQDLDYFKTK